MKPKFMKMQQFKAKVGNDQEIAVLQINHTPNFRETITYERKFARLCISK